MAEVWRPIMQMNVGLKKDWECRKACGRLCSPRSRREKPLWLLAGKCQKTWVHKVTRETIQMLMGLKNNLTCENGWPQGCGEWNSTWSQIALVSFDKSAVSIKGCFQNNPLKTLNTNCMHLLIHRRECRTAIPKSTHPQNSATLTWHRADLPSFSG